MSQDHKEMSRIRSELSGLVRNAANAEERAALVAFDRAMSPYLENPDQIMSAASKIQATLMSYTAQRDLETREFSSMDELKEALPENVRLVA